MSDIKLDNSECEALYFLLAVHEDTLSDELYSLKCRLEHGVFQRYTICEIEKKKAEVRKIYGL